MYRDFLKSQTTSSVTMPQYKLTYFDGRGRGELARLLFNAAGVAFEDVRIQFSEWPGKLKAGTPFGYLPVLECDGRELANSMAIARFLAKEFGLAGSDPHEIAKIDEAAECINAFFLDFCKAVFDGPEEEKEKRMEEFYNKPHPSHVEKIEKILSRNETKSGFLFGGKLSYADLFMIVVFDNFPSDKPMSDSIKRHLEMVKGLPNIAKYLSTRPTTQF